MLRAIETEHAGHLFRSRLEARWAILFEWLDIEYQYEIEGFDLGGGDWYLPDFWLPEYKFWIEIKPVVPTGEEARKCQKLAMLGGNPIYLLYGDVWYDLDPDKENGVLFDSQGGFPHTFTGCAVSTVAS